MTEIVSIPNPPSLLTCLRYFYNIVEAHYEYDKNALEEAKTQFELDRDIKLGKVFDSEESELTFLVQFFRLLLKRELSDFDHPDQHNLFDKASPQQIRTLLVAMLPTTDDDSNHWRKRFEITIEALLDVLCYLRDRGELILNLATLHEFFKLDNIIELYKRDDIPESNCAVFKLYLEEMPAFKPEEARAGRVHDKCRELHGYQEMMLSNIIGQPMKPRKELIERYTSDTFREAIAYFLRCSRKAGLTTTVTHNHGASNNTEFGELAARYFSLYDAPEELEFWSELITEQINDGIIYPIEKVRELLSEQEWDDLSIKGTPREPDWYISEYRAVVEHNRELMEQNQALQGEVNFLSNPIHSVIRMFDSAYKAVLRKLANRAFGEEANINTEVTKTKS